ncbi:hypothetical protein VTK56DRAFT_2997 [Thermocarpiscus australiensis]
MPPITTNSPEDTDSDPESQDSSDSESVHTIVHNPSKEESAEASRSLSEYAVDIFTSRISQSESLSRNGDHEDADPSNATKRKAESPGNGHVVKARRTSSSSESSSDSSDSDVEDIPAYAGYVEQSFSASEDPEPVVSKSETVTTPSWHPSFPKTARELYHHMFPEFAAQPLDLARYGALMKLLSQRPVRQIPRVSPKWTSAKPQNVHSFMMQATGDVVPDHERCDKCARGRGGVYKGCVVVRDRDIMAVTGGACANCWYMRQGSLCSFRTGRTTSAAKRVTPLASSEVNTLSADSDSTPARAIPAKQTPVPAPKLPSPSSTLPPNGTPKPAAPIHPSFVAALASGALASTPASVSTPDTTSTAFLGVARNLSLDDNVRAWETRYGGMSTEALLATQEHLMEWQEDVTARLMAMNRVVLQRLKEKEESTGR